MSTEAQQQPQERKDKMFEVFDLNQRGKEPRKHEVIVRMHDNGQEPEVETYSLWSDKATKMPMEHAMRFLSDPSFKVVNPAGGRVAYVPKVDPSKPISKLADDELVVKYEELSRESLFRRVKVLPGSEDVKENASPKELAAFLVAWRKRMAGMTEGDRRVAEAMQSGNLGGAMTDEQLETMFPKRMAA